MKKSYNLGIEGEKIASEYLKQMGYAILETRLRVLGGEIDIIAKDGKVFCFIEVKYRPKARLGEALESVDDNKRRTVRMAAKKYMEKNNIKAKMRFDIIEISRVGVWHLKGGDL
ncbi:MAG: YraN family protein [Eubacteriales bacterium]|nr:YraN family protein [Eubacteriales bacterium]